MVALAKAKVEARKSTMYGCDMLLLSAAKWICISTFLDNNKCIWILYEYVMRFDLIWFVAYNGLLMLCVFSLMFNFTKCLNCRISSCVEIEWGSKNKKIKSAKATTEHWLFAFWDIYLFFGFVSFFCFFKRKNMFASWISSSNFFYVCSDLFSLCAMPV